MRFLAVFSLLPAIALAEPGVVQGLKFPNDASEGSMPVSSEVLTPGPGPLPGFTELLPYVFRAPNQDNAGSCLFMSLTGIAEWWVARLNPELSRAPDGPLDLSERFLMNLAWTPGSQQEVRNWRSDSILIFNQAPGALRNADYRYTKGWFRKAANGQYAKAAPREAGAGYGTAYNWIDERASLGAGVELVRLPVFRREVLYADPQGDQWNTGGMPFEIVETIKTALREKKAPVQVIYNHFGYWHSTVIVGYSDETDNGNCRFVHGFLAYAQRSPVARLQEAYRKARAAYERGGGCHPRGVFYVRDSIYQDPSGPVYDYQPGARGDEAPYTRPLVLLEYDWIRYLGNHAMQVLAD